MMILGRAVVAVAALTTTAMLASIAVDAFSAPICQAHHKLQSASSITTSHPSRLSAATVDGVDARESRKNLDPLPSLLPLPPQKGGLLRRFRDTISYLKDPEGFIERRADELGPIFTMYQFFQPVVVVGGRDAVREFIQEREAAAMVIHPNLPPPFVALHTEWSALNMDSTQVEFQQARGLFKGLLQAPEARKMYVQSILPEIERYADGLVERVRANPEEEQFLVPDMKELCLQIYARIFSGEGTL